jgi:hypothetical protein
MVNFALEWSPRALSRKVAIVRRIIGIDDAVAFARRGRHKNSEEQA